MSEKNPGDILKSTGLTLLMMISVAALLYGLYFLIFQGYLIKVEEKQNEYKISAGFIQKETVTIANTEDNETQIFMFEFAKERINTGMMFSLFGVLQLLISPFQKWRGWIKKHSYTQVVMGILWLSTGIYYVSTEYPEVLEMLKEFKV